MIVAISLKKGHVSYNCGPFFCQKKWQKLSKNNRTANKIGQNYTFWLTLPKLMILSEPSSRKTISSMVYSGVYFCTIGINVSRISLCVFDLNSLKKFWKMTNFSDTKSSALDQSDSRARPDHIFVYLGSNFLYASTSETKKHFTLCVPDSNTTLQF